VKNCKKYLDLFIKSVKKHSSLVSEIVIAAVDSNEPYSETGDNIKIKRFGANLGKTLMWYGHGLGLHQALDHAENKYVIFSDPDVLWKCPLDTIFLNLMEKYTLNIIGVSHHNAVNQSYTFFPSVMTCMVEKAKLPEKGWLAGKIKLRNMSLRIKQLKKSDNYEIADDCYLVPGPIPDLYSTFPNKDDEALYDVGCNLWLWNQEKNGKWLSFQTIDCHNYSTKHNRSNFKSYLHLDQQDLLYHQGDSAKKEGLDIFLKQSD